MRYKRLGVAAILAASMVLLVNLFAPPKAEASIHRPSSPRCAARSMRKSCRTVRTRSTRARHFSAPCKRVDS